MTTLAKRNRRLRRRAPHLGGRRRDERGSSTIQLVVLLPVMFSVMFLGMQAALYFHARQVAIAAAQEGARDAGSENGTRESGESTARDFIGSAGGSDVLTGTQVSGSRNATTATVTVTGQSLSVIPGWKVTVTQSATVPVERLT
ncbi:MAG: TadE/TadG family type IV pilus assembly protein [Nocardioides sp.]